MKTLIEKLANGNVEYILPKAEVSDKEINVSVMEGEKAFIEFEINTVNDKDIKGVVFSKDPRVVIINDQFFGKRNVIKMYVSAKYLKAETKFNTDIIITSNAGEIVVPCNVEVTKIKLSTSIGVINSLEEFMKLVTHDYEEGLKLFLSKNFKTFLLKNDTYKTTLYEQLIKNTNREIAMEEFLVAMKLKNRAFLSIADTRKEYENISEAYGDTFQITRSCQGYVDIDVEIKGDFLHNSKTKITNDDFVGNTYEYPYLINSFKLHQGENRASIILKTATQTLAYEIVVKNKPADVAGYINHKKDVLYVMRQYVDFRCGKLKGAEWISKMDEISDSMLKKDGEDIVANLLKTQVSILSGNSEKAQELFSKLSNMVNSTDPDNIEFYCYYLYLKTLYKKNSSYTDDVKREIKTYFENGYDRWGLLWMILYLDDRYTQNPSLKYTLIKEQYNKGCKSPVMYYEAISVLNEQPALLRLINPFELQVINFGAKKGIISEKLTRQIMLLLEKNKDCNPVMLRSLMKIYENKSNREVLDGICRMLINSGKKQPEYYKWYDRGVEADLKLAELMEYYVYTISNQGYVELRPSVYMYFGYSAETLGEYQSYLFANIITNKNKLSDVYNEYKDTIEKYAVKQLLREHIDEDLAIVYENVFTKDYEMDDEMRKVLPSIVNAYEVTTDNDNVGEILICHKESVHVSQTTILNNRSVVHIYTKNPVIIFLDEKGRRLVNIEHKIKPMLNIEHLRTMAEQSGNVLMEIHNINKCMDNPKENANRSKLLISGWNNEIITSVYKYNLSEFIVSYCKNDYDNGDMSDFLLKLDSEKLSFESRNTLVETLIRREKYSEASGYIYKYGVTDIDDELVLKYVTETILDTKYAADDKILELCRYLFLKDVRNKIVMKYLQKYYEGPTDEMYDMWKSCIRLMVDDGNFTERLLVQTIFEGRQEERMLDIFREFHEKKAGRNIIKAYYTYVSYNYFIKKSEVSGEFFDKMEVDMLNGMKVAEICRMAYLDHMTTKNDITDRESELCKDIIYDLTEINVVFEFYKKFNKWFKMPYSILDKTIIDYRTNPKNKVFIMYTIYDEDGNAGKPYTEEMSSVYPGIFVKQLTMFYGEKVVYTIVDKDKDEIQHSSEKSITLTRKDIYNEENKFGQINGMLISNEVGRTDALDELMKNYEYNRQASEELFKLL